jgi:RNA polymerase sigma factor (sigma-70 family)
MNAKHDTIPTRASLLARLKDVGDQESWKAFFETYGKLIYEAATRSGLSHAEAEDVLQETMLTVSKAMPGFQYDITRGSFKDWLLHTTRWRITDQVRKRQRHEQRAPAASKHDDSARENVPLEEIPDPAGAELEANWDREWKQALMEAALQRVKRRVDLRQYQVFDLLVHKQWPVMKVARLLSLNPGSVYLAKHRVAKALKAELASLENRPL